MIIDLINERGPLTGSEIWETTGGEELSVWRTCKLSKRMKIQAVGTRYLRLDRRVEGFARLSPSILREFLTYSVVGLHKDQDGINRRAEAVMSHIEAVSRSKADLAYRIFSGLADRFENEWFPGHQICFILAGDIVYNMAHDVPRPERSTGKLVKGSDMDMVVIVEDECPKELMERLDEEIYREKTGLLMMPHMKEEIDYVVKNLSRVRQQLAFDTFKHMVACKILHEGAFLCGSEDLFRRVKGLLKDQGVIRKLSDLEIRARVFREDAEAYLLRETPEKILAENLSLFFPSEESEEFE